jgi:hypothetical protein
VQKIQIELVPSIIAEMKSRKEKTSQIHCDSDISADNALPQPAANNYDNDYDNDDVDNDMDIDIDIEAVPVPR